MYYLGIAAAVAARADCTRRQVGAIVVQGDRIAGTGYNGAPAGVPGCLSAGACPRGRLTAEQLAPGSSYDTGAGSCHALHAEQNAVLRAGYDGCRGSTLYLTHPPCDGCARLIAGAGIARVVVPQE
ncbi:deoxycytidylate deaminase [Actinoplanes campanulatus]|uniref:deoxycytidylate deaminase n=1 Tax=Actinoplanes campanulatus TaxID=113559 RepID=UPI001945A143|nr:deaminase [Actinoplanes campanulatus]